MQIGLSYDIARLKDQEILKKWNGEDLMNRSLKMKVAPGTPLTPTRRDFLVKKFKGDILKAAQEAKKLGYTLLTKEQSDRYGETF